jgi:hypothetical protein
MSLYNEDLQVFDEAQMIADNLARLRRKVTATSKDASKVVYPGDYVPPEVNRAKRRASYLASCEAFNDYEVKRSRQARANRSHGGYHPKKRR